jgi:hypothetical protein
MKSDNFKVVKFHIFLVLYFYLYPRMKQEYRQCGWSWKRYYDVCGDDNRLSYCKWLERIQKKGGGM